MVDKNSQTATTGQNMTETLKSWVMVLLTLIFVLLYAAALIGWLKPLPDAAMVIRLEPIIFVIIGYYFGRLPAQQNEKTLKDEINRQTQKADAAQHSKEQVQQEREALEEKVKNARAALNVGSINVSAKALAGNEKSNNVVLKAESLSQSVETAARILGS